MHFLVQINHNANNTWLCIRYFQSLAGVATPVLLDVAPICRDLRTPFIVVTILTAFSIQRTHTHTYIHAFNGPFRDYPGEPVQKGKTNLDFTEARDNEWQWHQLDHMQVCILLQADNHARTPPLSFLQAGCPSCRPTNSVTQSTEGIIQRTHGLANFVTTQLVFLSDE